MLLAEMEQPQDGRDHESVQILRLRSWGETPLLIPYFTEASLAPSRDMLLLHSDQRELMFVPLRSTGLSQNASAIRSVPPHPPTANTNFFSPSSKEELLHSSFGSPEASSIQQTRSIPPFSPVDKPPTLSSPLCPPLDSRYFPSIADAVSFCWGSGGEGYGSDEELAMFKEFLFVVGEKGLVIHAFPKEWSTLKNDYSTTGSSSGELKRPPMRDRNMRSTRGRWKHWGRGKLDQSIDADKVPSPGEQVYGCWDGNATREEKDNGNERSLVTFVIDAQVQKNADGIYLKFLESNCYLPSNKIVSYSVPYDSCAFSQLALFCEEHRFGCSQGSLHEPDLPEDRAKQALLGRYKFGKIFSGSSFDTLGMLLLKEEQYSDASKEDIRQDGLKSSLMILICKVLDSGVKWFSVIEPGKALTEVGASQWATFALAGNNLFGLHEKGVVCIWTVMDGQSVAHIDVLRHCGLPSGCNIQTHAPSNKTSLSGQELHEAPVDPHGRDSHLQAAQKGDSLSEQSNSNSVTPFNKRFLQMVVTADCLLLALTDSSGLVYLVSTDDYLLKHPRSNNSKNVPSSHIDLNLTSSWAVGATDIGSQLRISNLEDQSSLKAPSKREIGTAAGTPLGSSAGILSSCSSGFSSKLNLARFGVRRVRFKKKRRHPFREVLLPMGRRSTDITISLNSFAITQMVRFKDESQDNQLTVKMIHLSEELCDDTTLKSSSKPGFLQEVQLDCKQLGTVLPFCSQGCLHLVAANGLYVVLPPLSLHTCQWKDGCEGRWWFTGVSSENFLGNFEIGRSIKKTEAMFQHWQIEVLDKALIYDGLDEAEHLAAENGWCQRLVRLRRLQLALKCARLDEIEQALDGLVHVGAAEAGVPSVLFSALELMLNASGGDNELGQASRLLSVAARFATKLVHQYGMEEWQHQHQNYGKSLSKKYPFTSVSSMGRGKNTGGLYEMSCFLEAMRKLQDQLHLKRKPPHPGKKELGDESLVNAADEPPKDSMPLIDESGTSTGLYDQLTEKLALSEEAVRTKHLASREQDSMWLVRGLEGNDAKETSSEMFYRWEKHNFNLSDIVREALRSGRLPLAVVQLHRLQSRELVQPHYEQNAFKEVQGIGRAFAYELFCKGETAKAMAVLSRLGENIETALHELAFGTVSRYLRSQVIKELVRLDCLDALDSQILGTVSAIERAYPSSSFWGSYGAQQRLLPAAPTLTETRESPPDATLRLVCSLKAPHDLTIMCGEIDGVVLGCWGGTESEDTMPTALERTSPGYWAGAAVWLSVWDKRLLDRVFLEGESQMGDRVSWEACLQTQIACHNWSNVSSLIDLIPDTVLKDGELRVRLDCPDNLDLYKTSIQNWDVESNVDEKGSRHGWIGLDVDAVEMTVPRIKILNAPLGNVCTGWMWQLMEEKLAKIHIFLRSYWKGTWDLVSLLARAGLLSDKSGKSWSYIKSADSRKQSSSSRSQKYIKFHKDAVHATHELILRHCVRHSLPNFMGLYLDHHSLALDNMSAVVMQAVVGDCQWALWLLFSRIKGREYDASFANARTILARNFRPENLPTALVSDEFILTVDDMAMAGGEMMALSTLMHAPVPLEKCLCTGSVNRHDGPSWQCTLENLRPGLQRFPTLWHSLIAACFDPDTWCFTTGCSSRAVRAPSVTKGQSGLPSYLQWREKLFSSACGDTSLLQMLPRWLPKGVRRLLQVAVQGLIQGGNEQFMDYAGMAMGEVDAKSWEASLQKNIEKEFYASSKFEEKGVGAEHHLRRGRVMAAFNSLLTLRLQSLRAQGSVIRENVGKFQRGGQLHISSELQAALSPLTTHEEKYLGFVLPLAIINFENSVVVAACASFLELCGIPATILRVDVAALCRIALFYSMNGEGEMPNTDITIAPSESQMDRGDFSGNDVAVSLARALADEYMETGVAVLINKKADGSMKRVSKDRPSRAFMAVLQHLEKASIVEGLNTTQSSGSWLKNALGDGSELRAQQRESSERWSLVTTFCTVHQLPISTVYLTTLAKDNDWVGFLAEAQSEGCPLETLIRVASKEFTDARLQGHILTVLKSLQAAWQKPIASSNLPSAIPTSQPDNALLSVSVVPSELFGILAECEQEKHPGTALLSKAKDLRWPLLAIVASCFPDVTPVSCLTVWLEITAARETSSIKVSDAAAHIAVSVGAAVEATNALPSSNHHLNFRYNTKNPKRRRLASPERHETDIGGPMGSPAESKESLHSAHNGLKDGSLDGKQSSPEFKKKSQSTMNGAASYDGTEGQESLSKMVAILCEQQRFFPLLKAFELFTPSSALLPFIRFLQAFVQMRLSEASAHLAMFSAQLKEETHQSHHTQNRSGKGSTAWMAATAVTAADIMLTVCPSAYERRCLLQVLSGADFGDGGAAALRFRRLYWKIQLTEPALQQGSDSAAVGTNLDDDALLLALERERKWEEAHSWARQLDLSRQHAKSPVHHVTETQAEAMVAEWKEFLWDIPEERIAVWNHTHTLFTKYSFPPQQAGMFFLKHAEGLEQEISPSELHVILLMALQWLSGSITNTSPVYPLHLLRELETRIWLLAVESEVETQEAGGQKGVLPKFSLATRQVGQDTNGGSSDLDPINVTAKSVTIVDNHLKNSRLRTTDFSMIERENGLQARQSPGHDQNSSSVAGAMPKIKRRPRAYGQHKRIHIDRSGKSQAEQENIMHPGSGPAKKAETKGTTIPQEDAKAEEATASEDQTLWEERVGEQELERAVLSLLEVGQVSAARQLHHKLSPTHIPMELLLVEASQSIAMLSTPLMKGCIKSSMLHPSVMEHLLSLNLINDLSQAIPIEVLEAITKACREGCGRGICRRITAVAQVANFLDLSFSEAFEKQPAQLLQLLSLKGQDAFSEAQLLTETHPMPAASIARILTESFLKGLLAAHRGGYMDSSQREEGPAPSLWRPSDFLEWGKLCPSEPELGHALMRLVISGHDVPHACEVELLILAHHFYMASACLDGIDVLLALAATRVESYISEGDFFSLARLVTGINNFQALHLLLDILIENGQLEMLLQKRAAVDAAMESSASVRGFRMAVLSTLKHFNPHDLDAFAMVYEQFDMKHEMAALLESRAEKGLEQWLVQHDPEQSEELLELMRYSIEAAEVLASVDAGNKARRNCAQASLISLQLRIPEKTWLNLTETNARRLLVEQSRFQEALVVAEAYGLNQPGEWVPVLWNQMLHPGWIDQFLGEFVAALPLPPNTLMELARFYRAEVTARGDHFDFSTWLTPGGLPLEWARYLDKSFRCLLKYVRDVRVRVQLATLATGFADVLDVCTRILDKVPETAGPLILRKGHGGTYLPLM